MRCKSTTINKTNKKKWNVNDKLFTKKKLT